MANRTFNSGYSTGVRPSGIWRAIVTSVYGDYVSIKIPRLGLNNIYENVPYTGLTPSVDDRVWAAFIEGRSEEPVVFVGANDTTGDPSEADITEVIAGLGLSGGGDTGSVTLEFEPSELTTVDLSYDDKIVISDDSDGGEPKLVAMSDIVTTVHGEGSGEPIGHENRLDSNISFNHTNRVFTISPVGDSYTVWCKGTKHVKTSAETVTIGTGSGLYYISFNSSGVLQATTTFFDWANDTPTAYIYYNSNDTSKYMLFDERHGIVLDWQTHEYLHRTRGAAFANGFKVDFSGNDGSLPAPGDNAEDAQIDLQNSDDPLSTAIGTFFDEDLQVDIVHSNSPTANTWEQDLQGPARIPVFYLTDDGWTYDAPTDYPVKSGSTHATYNKYDSGSWTTPDVGNNQYGIYWIVATNQLNYPVISIMGQHQYDNVGAAEAVTWDSMTLTDLPIVELRVLYKIVFRATGSNVPGCYFEQIDDFRVAATASSAGTTVSDHGGLTGLGDDDHLQYLRVDGSRDADSLTVTGTVTSTGSFVSNGTMIVNLGMSGFTLANGISGSNFNIDGVNQITINDAGEGIAFPNVTLYQEDGDADRLTLNGNLLVSTGAGPNITIRDSDSADASGYISFEDSTLTRLGYIGYPNNDDLHIKNENTGGNIFFATQNTWCAYFNTSGNFVPYADSSFDLGSSTLRWTTAYVDTFNAGSDNLLSMNGEWNVIRRESTRGAVSFTSKDDSVYIGNGDVAHELDTTYVAITSENTYIASDGNVYIMTDLQEGWGTHHTFTFDNTGTATFPDDLFVPYIGVNTIGAFSGESITIGGTNQTAVMWKQLWAWHIDWGSGINIYTGGENSIDVQNTTGHVFQVWDVANSAPFIKCAKNARLELGQNGSKGVYVHGNMEAASSKNSELTLRSTFNGNWTAGDGFGHLTFYSNDASGGGAGIRARISAVARDVYGYETDMVFSEVTNAAYRECMRIGAFGFIGIGTSGPSEKLHVVGNLRVDGNFINNVPSDERLKKNVKTYDTGLSTLRQLNPVTFVWDCDEIDNSGDTQIGFIAQEVEIVKPEWSTTLETNSYVRTSDSKQMTDIKALSLSGTDFNAVLISAIKELADKFDDICDRLSALESA